MEGWGGRCRNLQPPPKRRHQSLAVTHHTSGRRQTKSRRGVNGASETTRLIIWEGSAGEMRHLVLVLAAAAADRRRRSRCASRGHADTLGHSVKVRRVTLPGLGGSEPKFPPEAEAAWKALGAVSHQMHFRAVTNYREKLPAGQTMPANKGPIMQPLGASS